jgi:hypothetical protein
MSFSIFLTEEEEKRSLDFGEEVRDRTDACLTPGSTRFAIRLLFSSSPVKDLRVR